MIDQEVIRISVNVSQALIKGISARSGTHAGNWTSSLAEKLRSYWRLGPLEGQPPFAPQRRYEAPAYAILPLDKRFDDETFPHLLSVYHHDYYYLFLFQVSVGRRLLVEIMLEMYMRGSI